MRHSGRISNRGRAQMSDKRLDSWKEIATYLDRHVTTVRRWERYEGLPVHRHVHAKLGSIYAYVHELDSWFASRRRDPMPTEAEPRPAVETDKLPPPPSIASLERPIALVGRETELQTLEGLWDLATRERQQVALISGPTGIGKTSLAHEFARRVASRATVLAGRCDREGLAPFAPFIAILQWLVRTTPLPILRRHVTDLDGLGELAQLVPELTTRIRLATDDPAATLEGHRYRMFEACALLLRATSRSGPVLLVIDDVQWADRGSLLLLRHLVRSTREAAVCIVLNYRDDEINRTPNATDILEDIVREDSVTRIALTALTEDDVRAVTSRSTSSRARRWAS